MREVPIWALIALWLIAIPELISADAWWWMKVPLFLPFIALTILRFRKSPSS
ncbi:MAG: hypothetical protein VYE73_11260 [Acidobacteriota bacterium]|nr:hypothetical protein [Acidobacteriota bacterium]